MHCIKMDIIGINNYVCLFHISNSLSRRIRTGGTRIHVRVNSVRGRPERRSPSVIGIGSVGRTRDRTEREAEPKTALARF